MDTQIFETEVKNTFNSEPHSYVPPDIVIENEIGRRNLCDLERIRNIILIEEDKPLELEQVLARVLDHYNKFVHYR